MPDIRDSTLVNIIKAEIRADGSYDVPEGVTSIGLAAFRECTSLREISLPIGITFIGSFAFKGCTSLQEITFPVGLTSIGFAAFNDCTSLREINLPAGLTSIEINAFRRCTSLQKITLPIGLTSIGGSAFQDCTSLQEINFPVGITSIGSFAFQNCTSLQEINFPVGITSIGIAAFMDCTSLQEITLPTGVTSISAIAFNECPKLRCIVIDSMNSEEIERVGGLLPEHLRSKVISKSLAIMIEERIQAQLKKIAKKTTNPLFTLLSINGLHGTKKSTQEKMTLPDVVQGEINTFLLDSNPYCKKAKTLMTQIPIPKSAEGLSEFEEQLVKITHSLCAEADKKREATLKLREGALVRAEAEKAAVEGGYMGTFWRAAPEKTRSRRELEEIMDELGLSQDALADVSPQDKSLTIA